MYDTIIMRKYDNILEQIYYLIIHFSEQYNISVNTKYLYNIVHCPLSDVVQMITVFTGICVNKWIHEEWMGV